MEIGESWRVEWELSGREVGGCGKESGGEGG